MTKKIISFLIGIVMIIFCVPLNIFSNIQNIQILPKAILLTDEELEEYTIQRLYGDLNGDGYTNVIDFLFLKSYLLDEIDVLPVWNFITNV